METGPDYLSELLASNSSEKKKSYVLYGLVALILALLGFGLYKILHKPVSHSPGPSPPPRAYPVHVPSYPVHQKPQKPQPPQPYSPSQQYTSYQQNSGLQPDAQNQLNARYDTPEQARDAKYGNSYSHGNYTDFRPNAYASAHNNTKQVQEVDENGFKQMMDKGLPVVVAFVANGCGHCTALKPKFTEAAKTARLPFLQVEYSKAGNLCKALGISGFPTIVRFEGGQRIKDYRGDRSAASLAEFGS